MFNKIHQALPRRQAEHNSELKLSGQVAPRNPSAKPDGGDVVLHEETRARDLGKYLMSQNHGETFACHYYAALAAAGALDGDAFLGQYRSLKRQAREQGMTDSDFRSFEKCLYRRFYQAGTQDSIRAMQSGYAPKVKPNELAYIAEVAAIPEAQLQRYTLALKRSVFVGQIKALQA